MNITGKYWFSGMVGLVGIVVGTDEVTRKPKGYIGIASGLNEPLDAQHIAETGSPVVPEYLEEIVKKLRGIT